MGFELGTLPDFPWDSLDPYRAQACAYPRGMVDLSVGTPVDPTPAVAQRALAQCANSPGYPATYGTPELRQAVADHYRRRRGVVGLDPNAVLPTIGSKELVALLPSMLGLGPGDVVIHPSIAYPTYDVGARMAGATPLPCDAPSHVPDAVASHVRLVWLNSPSNPDGEVAGIDLLREWTRWARERGALVACDECYAELAWDAPYDTEGVPSILDTRVAGPDRAGVLAVYSLSKQSSMAGYRAAWVAGDLGVVRALLELRKHMGMLMPGPVQAAMLAALGDDDHVAATRERYGSRRAVLADAIRRAGMSIDGSHAGLYLWVRADDGADCWQLVERFARQGILVAPGDFYGPTAHQHVRVALTATDRDIESAAERLAGQ